MNRKLLIITGIVFLFVVVALVWYFFYTKPVISPSLGATNDPLPKNELPPRYQFIGGKEGDEQTSVTEVTQKPEDPLIRVWDKPATGQVFVTEQILKEEVATTTQGTTTVEIKRAVRATTTLLLFVDRGTGYVYGYSPENNSVFQITNTVIAGVYDAYIFNNGKKIILRYPDIKNRVVVGVIATIPPFSRNGNPSPLTDLEYLNSEVTSVAVAGDNSEASYAVKTTSGSAVYKVKNGSPEVFTVSPFGEWDLSYGGNTLYATSKPSSFALGIMTELPNFSIMVGERAGLMTKPSLSYFLGSVWLQGGIATFLSGNAGTRTLSLKTLASKCGWGGENFVVCGVPRSLVKGGSNLPDAWFQGLVSFEDDLVSIDLGSGNINFLEEAPFFYFEEKYGKFDVTSVTISPDIDFISFVNKRNSELWLIKRELAPVLGF